MANLYNLARMTTATVGTGTVTLGAAVSGYLTFALAGVTNGEVIDYAIKDGANSEHGTGTYTSAGTTLTRTVTKSTNANAAINLSGTAEVFISPRAETLNDASLIKTGIVAAARLGSGAADSTKVLRGDSSWQATPVPPPQGRLTLMTATPVMSSDASAATTIYYTPYIGNLIPIYDGTAMVPTAFSQVSVATTDTTKNPAAIGASKVNDWFVWNDGGALRLSHGPDWTSDTVRSAGTALVMVNGVLLNSVAITNGPGASRGTYVGTTRSNASSQLDYKFGGSAADGTAAFLGVWNAYNRVSVPATITSTSQHTYTSATIRQWNNVATMQATFVHGVCEDGAQASIAAEVYGITTATASPRIGLGINSTTTFSRTRLRNFNVQATYNSVGALAGSFVLLPAIGVTVLSFNEASDGSNANQFNNNSDATLSVMLRL